MSTIRIQSSDGDVFDVEERVAKSSGTIKTMLEECFVDEVNAVIPVPNVTTVILKKVLEYAEHHKNDPMLSDDEESKQEKRTDDISAWDADFLKVDQGTLFELILAANYLDAKKLLDVTCKTVANMIKGKTPEEIRKTFNIQCDFSPAEMEKIRKENEWCEEN